MNVFEEPGRGAAHSREGDPVAAREHRAAGGGSGFLSNSARVLSRSRRGELVRRIDKLPAPRTRGEQRMLRQAAEVLADLRRLDPKARTRDCLGADLDRVPPLAVQAALGRGQTAPRSARGRPARTRGRRGPPASHRRRLAAPSRRAPRAVPTKVLQRTGRLPARAHRASLSAPLRRRTDRPSRGPRRGGPRAAGCVDCTNNVVEQFFGTAKQGLRRRVDRAHLGCDWRTSQPRSP